MNRNRQPAGTPAGGQFAETRRPAATITLRSEQPAAKRDVDALDEIALILGSEPEWNAGDLLPDIANIISDTGRPHPGDDEDYRAVMSAYLKGKRSGDKDTLALDRIAVALGTADSWSYEDTDEVARLISTTGRPHPGTGSGGRYYRALRTAALEQGRRERDPRDDFEDALDSGAYGENTHLLRQLIDEELRADEDEVFEGPRIEPRLFAHVDDEFLAQATVEREKLVQSVQDHAADAIQWIPAGSSPPSEERVREHVKEMCGEGFGHMEEFILAAVADAPLAQQGVMALDSADAHELEYHLEVATGRLERALHTADEAAQGGSSRR